MGGKWPKEIVEKVLDGLDNHFDNLDEDELQEAIEEAIDLKKIVQDILGEDPDVHQKLREKVKEGLIDLIDRLDEIEFNDGDSFEGHLMENLDLAKELKTVISTDEELKKDLYEKIKEAAENHIDNMDTDDLVDWDDLRKMIAIPALCRQALDSEAVQNVLKEKTEALIEQYVGNNLDEDDLPEDIMERVGVPEQIKKVLEDKESKERIERGLGKVMQQLVFNVISERHSELTKILLANSAFSSLMSREISRLMRDEKVVNRISDEMRRVLLGQEEKRKGLGERVIGILLGTKKS